MACTGTCQHPIFGDYLTTSPFGSYGGFAYSSIASRDALLEKARALANDLGVEYVNVRFEAGEETPPEGWIQHPTLLPPIRSIFFRSRSIDEHRIVPIIATISANP